MMELQADTHVVMSGRWDELKEYGINVLTGESCAYSMRILCDLNLDGTALLERFFGGTLGFTHGSNWNRSVNGKDSVASVLLPYGIIHELEKFILFDVEKCAYIYQFNDAHGRCTQMIGTEHNEWPRSNAQVLCNPARIGGHPQHGGRNVHAFTGRAI